MSGGLLSFWLESEFKMERFKKSRNALFCGKRIKSHFVFLMFSLPGLLPRWKCCGVPLCWYELIQVLIVLGCVLLVEFASFCLCVPCCSGTACYVFLRLRFNLLLSPLFWVFRVL